MEKKAFIVTGLGFGDEGKGTTTNWLSYLHRAHTVVRFGGPQALHHVVTSSGKSHVFSQFGSGSLQGAATHLSKHMLIDPSAILKEGEALKNESGVTDVFERMTIHEDALVITPFQAIAGRVRELLRNKNRNSSVGIGVGETMLDAEEFGDFAIRAKDLKSPEFLSEKLRIIKHYKWAQFEEYADRASDLPAETAERIRSELAQMEAYNTLVWALVKFEELVKRVRIVNTEYAAEKIFGTEGAVVLEGSQGVLLDRYHGFHPYTTKVRTTPMSAKEILSECGYRGEVKSIGVLRAYHTRHGRGPFVTESSELTLALPDEVNQNHPWQGNFRVGPLDLIAAQYALEACGEGAIDALVITCLDRVLARGSWDICDKYSVPNNADMKFAFRFNPTGEIIAIKAHANAESPKDLKRQEKIGKFLGACTPQFFSHNLSSVSQEEFTSLCVKTIEEALHVPIMAVSCGQTELEKFEKQPPD